MEKFRKLKDSFVPALVYFMPNAALIALLLFIYSSVPFYAGFLSYLAKDIIRFGGLAYIAAGFLYYSWAAASRPILLEDRLAGDYFWAWIARLPSALLAAIRSRRLPSVFEPIEAKRKVLGIFVKAFFFPLMLQFFLANVRNAVWGTRIFSGPVRDMLPISGPGYAFWVSALLIVDTGIFMFAYIIEHTGLGNRLKSVDPTFGGWFVALICYPPFNFYTLRRFRELGAAAIGGVGTPIISQIGLSSNPTLLISRGAAFLMFFIYVWATVALGWRSGNLVNRGIISRGPYRFVRHPAYIAKNLGWWFEYMPFITPAAALALLLVNAVYALRAFTEERHLNSDPDYREYSRRVRWRFIPGLV